MMNWKGGMVHSQYNLLWCRIVKPAPTPANTRWRALTGLSAPGIRLQTSCDRLRELHVSEVFTVITETRETKGPRDTPIFIG